MTTHDPADERPGGTALVIIDMISRWDFPDADLLGPQALAVAPRIARLKARCKAASVPVIYANDNQGRWRSDLRVLVRESLDAPGPGRAITQQLAPDDDDYFVLKPCLSAFFATPLELLIGHLLLRRLLLVGVAADQCVLATAADAKMRGHEVLVPRDCVAAQTPARTAAAVLHFADVLKLPTPPSTRLRP